MNFDRLTALLLERAVRGELVPQLDGEPAVEQIGEAPKDMPFAIPGKWKWVQLDCLLQFIDYRGKTPKKSTSGIRLITASNIKCGYIDHKRVEYISELEYKTRQSRGISKKGDVLFTTEAPLGHAALADLDTYSAGQRVITLRSLNGAILHSIVVYFILSPFFQRALSDNSTGTTAQGIKAARLKKLWLPVPPVEEQVRIVRKLNELLREVSRAETAYEDLCKYSKSLRKRILQEAMRGAIVPQLDTEPAVEKLDDAPVEVPFEIPEKWKWVRLSKVGKVVGGGTPKTSISDYWDGGTINWFTPSDLGKLTGLYASESARKITELGLKESSAVMMPKDSVLFSSRAPIGHIALAEEKCCTNQGCKSFVPNTELVDPLWGYYAMKARTPDMIARASGTTFKEISGKGVGETFIPLPPIDEQRRIVQKLTELLGEVEKFSA